MTFHCDGCGCCMGLALKDNHGCKASRLDEDCAVCLEKMFTSRDPPTFLRCGHSMHSKCYNSYLKRNIACPICRKCVIDPALLEA